MAERPPSEQYAHHVLTKGFAMVPVQWLQALLDRNEKLTKAIRNLPHASGCPGRAGNRCVCGRSVLYDSQDSAEDLC